MIKKAACILLCGLMCFCAHALCEEADAWPEVIAKAAVLIDRQSGRVLFGLNENEMLPIASTTKVMTALLALENSELSEVVVAGERAHGVPGTSIYLGIGEELTMHQMLEAMMLRSANDAAVAIAEHIDGSVEAFAERMNSRARELSADASFKNPNGLDEQGHAVSALGLCRIACEAMKNPVFRELVTTQMATLPWRDSPYERILTNKNKLLSTYEGATGIKTGFTKKAGRCLVFSAERDGMEVIGVVLNCGQWFESAAQLMDFAFSHYRIKTFLRDEQVAIRIPVMGGSEQSVNAVAISALSAPIAKGEEAFVMVEAPDMLTAPVERGTEVGSAWIEVDGVRLNEVKLIARESVGEWGFLPALRRVARHWAVRFG